MRALDGMGILGVIFTATQVVTIGLLGWQTAAEFYRGHYGHASLILITALATAALTILVLKQLNAGRHAKKFGRSLVQDNFRAIWKASLLEKIQKNLALDRVLPYSIVERDPDSKTGPTAA